MNNTNTNTTAVNTTTAINTARKKEIVGRKTFTTIDTLIAALSRVAGEGISTLAQAISYINCTAGGPIKSIEADGFKIELVNGESGYEYLLTIYLDIWEDAILPDEEYLKHQICRCSDRDWWEDYKQAINGPQGEFISRLMDQAIFYYTTYRKEVESKN